MTYTLTALEFILALLGSSGVTTVLGYVIRRALYKKEVEEKNSDIILKNMTIYQNMLDDVTLRYELKVEERDEEIQALRAKVIKLEKIVNNLRKDNGYSSNKI